MRAWFAKQPWLTEARIRWFALALILAVVYALWPRAAAPGLNPGPTPQTATAQVEVAGSPPPAEVVSYSEAIAGRPRDINPLLSKFNDADQDLVSLIFSGLTAMSASGEARPALARSWEISDDGLVYTFTLRGDVKWHDGELFTSRDVSSTIALLQAPDFPATPQLADFWRKITVQTFGDSIVTFTLSEPFAPFLTQTSLGILPAHIIEKVPPAEWAGSALGLRPIGTGPFRLAKLDPARATVTLERFADYYGARPQIERIELRFYPNESAALAAFQRGEVMGVAHVPSDRLAEVRRMPSAVLYAAPVSGFDAIYLNLKSPLFQAKEVRQALLLALDRQKVIDRALDGQGLVAHSPLLPSSWAYNRFVRKYEPDVPAAKALMAKAGWADSNRDGILDKGGVAMDFAIMSRDDPVHQRVIEEISRQWEALGVKARTQVIGFSGLARDFLRPRKFDTVYVEWHDPTADPDLYPLWHSTQINDEGQNYSGWVNRDADELLEQARRSNDPQQRAALYAKFQDLFAEQVPALLINYPVYVYAVNRRVQNVQVGLLTQPSDRFENIADWTIAPAAAVSSATPQASR
ncbi:MAG: peptide ABC transporter substrate-binding protein [Chloroflexi bacterium]|nr:peptide ABC transporter substrate-binding protein [Chloroflexota bacterium]